MITLLHGENTEASRAELLRLKSTYTDAEIREIDGRGLDEAMLIQALESKSLFSQSTVVIIENLFGKLGRKIKLIEALASILKKSGNSTTIILWENKEVGKTVGSGLG